MARYRVLKHLLGRERKGEISPLKGLTQEQIKKLEAVGAVECIIEDEAPQGQDKPVIEESGGSPVMPADTGEE